MPLDASPFLQILRRMYIITVSGVKHPIVQSFVYGTLSCCKYILSGSLSFTKSPKHRIRKVW